MAAKKKPKKSRTSINRASQRQLDVLQAEEDRQRKKKKKK